MEYADYLNVLQGRHPWLAEELAGCQNLEQVLDWMNRREIVKSSVDLVTQDEFSYDFLVQLEAAGPWLAFGVT